MAFGERRACCWRWARPKSLRSNSSKGGAAVPVCASQPYRESGAGLLWPLLFQIVTLLHVCHVCLSVPHMHGAHVRATGRLPDCGVCRSSAACGVGCVWCCAFLRVRCPVDAT